VLGVWSVLSFLAAITALLFGKGTKVSLWISTPILLGGWWVVVQIAKSVGYKKSIIGGWTLFGGAILLAIVNGLTQPTNTRSGNVSVDCPVSISNAKWMSRGNLVQFDLANNSDRPVTITVHAEFLQKGGVVADTTDQTMRLGGRVSDTYGAGCNRCINGSNPPDVIDATAKIIHCFPE